MTPRSVLAAHLESLLYQKEVAISHGDELARSVTMNHRLQNQIESDIRDTEKAIVALEKADAGGRELCAGRGAE